VIGPDNQFGQQPDAEQLDTKQCQEHSRQDDRLVRKRVPLDEKSSPGLDREDNPAGHGRNRSGGSEHPQRTGGERKQEFYRDQVKQDTERPADAVFSLSVSAGMVPDR